MTPLDVKTEHEWTSVLERFAAETKMTAMLTDDEGSPLLVRGERYPLCAAVRAEPEASTFVCSQINTAMLAAIRNTLRPEVDQCDLGLLRIVVPIVRDGAVIGQIAACGLRAEDEEPDAFLAAKQLGRSEDEVASLAESTPGGSEEELLAAGQRLFEELSSR
jgi:ligand-binding sensor protein